MAAWTTGQDVGAQGAGGPTYQAAAYGEIDGQLQGLAHPASTPGLSVGNFAFRGATTAGLLAMPWDEEMDLQPARVVVLSPSGSDDGTSLAHYTKNLHRLVSIAQSRGKVVVLVEPGGRSGDDGLAERRRVVRATAHHLKVLLCLRPDTNVGEDQALATCLQRLARD